MKCGYRVNFGSVLLLWHRQKFVLRTAYCVLRIVLFLFSRKGGGGIVEGLFGLVRLRARNSDDMSESVAVVLVSRRTR